MRGRSRKMNKERTKTPLMKMNKREKLSLEWSVA